MTGQRLAADYADAITDELWRLDESGEVFPHECERTEQERAEESCEDSMECMDELGAIGYLDSALDIEVVTTLNGVYRGARVLIAFGGPNAIIDTQRRRLEVSWDENVSRGLPREMCARIDELIEENYLCR